MRERGGAVAVVEEGHRRERVTRERARREGEVAAEGVQGRGWNWGLVYIYLGLVFSDVLCLEPMVKTIILVFSAGSTHKLAVKIIIIDYG